MARKKEDEFKQKVKDALSRRVAQRCSNPDCRVPTAAPGETELKVNNVGVAAHIHAASPGGPRYDPTMSPSERSSISNAIWLCSICSIKIDLDEARYTAPLLREWKRAAEDTATREQGTKLPSDEDAINLTTMALTGHPQKLLTKGIQNVHTATARAIEQKDPRFEVITQYKDGQTIFEYRAKEDVTFTFNVKGNEEVESIRRMLEEGQDAKLPAKHVDIIGDGFPNVSPDRNSHIQIKKDGIEAIHRIWLVDSETKITEQFNDVHGKAYFGTKAMRFEGVACAGLFSMSYSRPLSLLKEDSNFNLSVNFSRWNGKNIKELPFFNKIKNFFDSIFNGAVFHTSLEIDGDVAFKANTDKIKGSPGFYYFDSALLFIKNARIISNKLDREIIYDSGFTYTEEEAIAVYDAANTLNGKLVVNEEGIKENAKLGLTLSQDGKELGSELLGEKASTLEFTEEGGVLNLYGQEVQLPDKHVCMKSVYLKPLKKLKSLKKGDFVEFECVPADGYEYSCFYTL
ncbi:hypothetical protein QHL1GM_02600 [Halomonas sp. QHL1]|nr:hypothetical protein QHL1GM_02600 [Halomonas sp. QHL1]